MKIKEKKKKERAKQVRLFFAMTLKKITMSNTTSFDSSLF